MGRAASEASMLPVYDRWSARPHFDESHQISFSVETFIKMPLFFRPMLSKDQILTRIEQHKETIKQFGVQKLTLFGSYAQGEAKKNSDIDFLVEFEPGRGLFDDYVGLLHFLETLLGKRVDLGEPALIKEELKPSIFGGIKIEASI